MTSVAVSHAQPPVSPEPVMVLIDTRGGGLHGFHDVLPDAPASYELIRAPAAMRLFAKDGRCLGQFPIAGSTMAHLSLRRDPTLTFIEVDEAGPARSTAIRKRQ